MQLTAFHSKLMLPDIAGRFSKLLPATYAMNVFNSLAMGKIADFSSQGSVIVLLFDSLLPFALAVYLFNGDQHNVTWREFPLIGILSFLPYIASIFLLP